MWGVLYLIHRQQFVQPQAISRAMLQVAIRCGFFPEIHLKPYFKIERNEVFLDVGACLGIYAMLLSSRCKHVFAWEPDPETCRLLKANTFRFRNVTCFNTALGNTEGVLTFYAYNDQQGHGSFVYKYDGAKTIKIHVKPLDSYCFEDKIGLIKIDAEGYEVPIIEGSLMTLRKHKPRLIVEVHRPQGKNEQEIKKLLPQYEWTKVFEKDLVNFHLVGTHVNEGNDSQRHSEQAIAQPM